MPDTRSPRIEYYSLSRQHSALGDELAESIAKVVRAGERQAREVVAEFEDHLGQYCGTRHAVGTASGTDALEIALSVLDLPHGSEVITGAFGFYSTVAAIVRCGLTPVLIDVEPGTFNLNPECLSQAVTPLTRVLLPVHLFGKAASINSVSEIAREYSLAVIEDSAQALGCTVAERPVGANGVMGCLSFNWSKNLATMGNGGALLSDDEELAQKARVMQNYGAAPPFVHNRLGLNSKLDPLEAAVLLVKLRHLAAWNSRRVAIANRYTSLLQVVPDVVTPQPGVAGSHTYHKYTVLAKDRDTLREYLALRGIETMVFYPRALHQQPCFADIVRLGPGGAPISEGLPTRVLSLPMYPELMDEEVDYVARTITAYYGRT